MKDYEKVEIVLQEEINRIRRLKDKKKFNVQQAEFSLKRLAEKVYDICR